MGMNILLQGDKRKVVLKLGLRVNLIYQLSQLVNGRERILVISNTYGALFKYQKLSSVHNMYAFT